ncbi:Oidioi.mRNA.OKI2018_I69.XSR.g14074.t1.cds [Oikopleura dioica]|uniref:Oidioi.mRNA.OKI2018_I69.XSR.g14074.t1.cds n=1 Tax=Oikopleura dioica TaxID=34765 RepID=A0ABN7SCS6_OIKDI|nr:Oidioi.mRNA.OKI2018_I69.XSR.g14074.t1.cds [Oikopleura dioica]
MKLAAYFSALFSISFALEKCPETCECDCGASYWSKIKDYADCDAIQMLSVTGLMEKKTAKALKSACNDVFSVVEPVDKLLKAMPLDEIAQNPGQICAAIGAQLGRIEKERTVDLSIVKKLAPQCRCLVKNLALALDGKPDMAGIIACASEVKNSMSDLRIPHYDL